MNTNFNGSPSETMRKKIESNISPGDPGNGRPSVKPYDLKTLKASHREIARLLITGLKITEIAHLMNRTPAGVRLIIRSPLFIALYSELCKEADLAVMDFAQKIQSLRESALDTVEEILDSDEIDKALKVKTAFDILDRAPSGHKSSTSSIQVDMDVKKTFITYELPGLRPEESNQDSLHQKVEADLRSESIENMVENPHVQNLNTDIPSTEFRPRIKNPMFDFQPEVKPDDSK